VKVRTPNGNLLGLRTKLTTASLTDKRHREPPAGRASQRRSLFSDLPRPSPSSLMRIRSGEVCHGGLHNLRPGRGLFAVEAC
jgi:hypothetical protein